jgi:hypothetical protein
MWNFRMTPTGKQIEVHASRKMIDQKDGFAAAHERTRPIGQVA